MVAQAVGSNLLSPPRNWPACFKDPALQQFLEKSLSGQRVRLCAPATEADTDLFDGIELSPTDCVTVLSMPSSHGSW